MTIATTSNKAIGLGNGVTTNWPFLFLIPAASQLYLYYTDALGNITLIASGNYTVAGINNPSGGSVTYPTSGSPIATGTSLTVYRLMPYQQLTDVTNQGAFYPEVYESALDNQEMQIQQLAEITARSFTLPLTVSGVSVTLPTPVANTSLVWNSTGTALVNGVAGGSISLPLSLGQGGTGQTTAAAALTALGGAKSGAVTASGLTQTTARLLGRTTAATGAIEEIAVGTGLSLSAGNLTATVTPATIPSLLQNVGIAITMAANAVTIALKDAAGADPSASSPAVVGWRDATVTVGNSSIVTQAAAKSTVISSGSTGGTVSGQPSRIWVGAILVSGALELAWYNALTGTAAAGTLSIAPINESGLISTTAEGGAGAADSAGVWYSTTARSNVPVVIVACFDSTQATAGTWASGATTINVNPKFRPGDVVQVQRTAFPTLATGATAMPVDNTIPQITEGDQFMTQAITPIAAANLLRPTAKACLYVDTAGAYGFAMFRDATANALKSNWWYMDAAITSKHPDSELQDEVVAASVSATTFRFRAGGNGGGTTSFNGNAGAQVFNGTSNSYFQVEEISV